MLPRTYISPQTRLQRKCKPAILPARGQKSLSLGLDTWKPDHERLKRTNSVLGRPTLHMVDPSPRQWGDVLTIWRSRKY
jgi:hypothetical protein